MGRKESQCFSQVIILNRISPSVIINRVNKYIIYALENISLYHQYVSPEKIEKIKVNRRYNKLICSNHNHFTCYISWSKTFYSFLSPRSSDDKIFLRNSHLHNFWLKGLQMFSTMRKFIDKKRKLRENMKICGMEFLFFHWNKPNVLEIFFTEGRPPNLISGSRVV